MPSNRRRGRGRRQGDPNRISAPQGGPSIPGDIDLRSLDELEAAGITTARSLAALSERELRTQVHKHEPLFPDSGDFAAMAEVILAIQAEMEDEGWARGILEIEGEGYGLIRRRGITGGPDDIYVPAALIRRMHLRQGDVVGGVFRLPNEGERFNRIVRVELVGGMDPEAARKRPHFGDLTPVHPHELLDLEIGRAHV